MLTEKVIVENISDRRLKNAETKILAEGLLKFRGLNEGALGTKRRQPINVLLDILNYSMRTATLYSNTETLQCDRYRRRSQGDLFRLMKYYYPDITFKQFRALLFELVNNRIISMQYCSTIKKRVVHKLYINNRKAYSQTSVYGESITDWRTNKIIMIIDEFGFTLRTKEIKYDPATRNCY